MLDVIGASAEMRGLVLSTLGKLMPGQRRCRRAGPGAAGTAIAAVVVALAGCSGHAPPAPASTADSQGLPAWAGKLGSGVMVQAPAATAPGHRTPGAVVQGFAAALDSGKLASACPYYPPTFQAECRAELGSAPVSAGSAALSMKGFAIGYVAVDGAKALVGSTGKFCAVAATPACSTNSNPAAIFATGKSFATLWSQAIRADSAGSGSSYSLAPVVRIDGQWYMYNPPGGP